MKAIWRDRREPDGRPRRSIRSRYSLDGGRRHCVVLRGLRTQSGDPLSTGIEGNLAKTSNRILAQSNHRGRLPPIWPGTLRHAIRSQRDNRGPRIRQYACVSRRPASAEFRAIEQGRENDRRTYGAFKLCNILSEVLTHQEDKRNAVRQFDELHSTARDIRRFPPANLRVKRTP